MFYAAFSWSIGPYLKENLKPVHLWAIGVMDERGEVKHEYGGGERARMRGKLARTKVGAVLVSLAFRYPRSVGLGLWPNLYRNTTAISCFISTGAILIMLVVLDIFLYQRWFKPKLTLNYINKLNVLMVLFYAHNRCLQVRKKNYHSHLSGIIVQLNL